MRGRFCAARKNGFKSKLVSLFSNRLSALPPGNVNRTFMESNPAASSGEAVATDTTPEWVVFSCDDQHFGIPLLLTREVVLPQALTRLPGCGAEVGGLMGLRGRVITVFDLGVVLGRGRVLQRPDHRILV